MNIKKEFYADGLTQLHFAGGMVRFDFATFQPDTSGKGGAPLPQKNLRLVMNLHGFLTMFDTMTKLSDKMLEAGLLRKNFTGKLDD